MTDQELALNRGCDALLEIYGRDMLALGADPARIVDRMLTYAAAQVVCWHGAAHAAAVLRRVADQVEAGALSRVDPTAPRNRN